MSTDPGVNITKPTLDLSEAHACGCDHDSTQSTHTATGAPAQAPDGSRILDVREIPHAVRHQTVFDALSLTPEGSSLIVIAPHDPLPLLRQIEGREPGAFDVSYEEARPAAWTLRLTRVDH
jgi:uncharacterized protein (DUF2249 family)